MSKVFSSFLLLLVLPPLFYVALQQSSLAMGSAVVAFILLIANLRTVRAPQLGFRSIVLGVLICFSTVVAWTFSEVKDPVKVSVSCVIFAVMLMSTRAFALFLLSIRQRSLIRAVERISMVGAVLGVASLFFRIEVFGYGEFPKSMFPFAEPSHFAIAFSGFFLFYAVRAPSAVAVVWIAFIGILGALLPSVSLLVVALLAILLRMRSFRDLVLGGAGIGVGFALLYFVSDFSYFSERLMLTGQADNISSLVYLQGWQESGRAVIETAGFGVGFQNSVAMSAGGVADRIFEILGVFKNREDFGFLAAKLIVEMGIVGIILCVAYVHLLMRCTLSVVVSRVHERDELNGVIRLFCVCFVVAFFIEMFVRGVGYFTSGCFMFLVVLQVWSFLPRTTGSSLRLHAVK